MSHHPIEKPFFLTSIHIPQILGLAHLRSIELPAPQRSVATKDPSRDDLKPVNKTSIHA